MLGKAGVSVRCMPRIKEFAEGKNAGKRSRLYAVIQKYIAAVVAPLW